MVILVVLISYFVLPAAAGQNKRQTMVRTERYLAVLGMNFLA